MQNIYNTCKLSKDFFQKLFIFSETFQELLVCSRSENLILEFPIINC